MANNSKTIAPPPKSEEPEDKTPSAPFFLTTYSDLVTLLLCMFILLFAMSSTQEESFKDLAESLQSALGVYSMPRAGTMAGIIAPSETSKDNAQAVLGGSVQKEVNEIVSEVREMIISNKLTGDVEVQETPSKVVIRIFDNILFQEDAATIEPQGLDLMERIVSILKNFSYRISVEGHTDKQTNEYSLEKTAYNWRLSSLRACNVVDFLIQKGIDPNFLVVKSYGEYSPIANNETPEGRARNRRVEIIYNRNDIGKTISQKPYK